MFCGHSFVFCKNEDSEEMEANEELFDEIHEVGEGNLTQFDEHMKELISETRGGSTGHIGRLKSIRVVNFMNHVHHKWDLSPEINWITGTNGCNFFSLSQEEIRAFLKDGFH